MAQIGMFDGTQKFKIDKPIRLVEIFGGIGAQSKALERLGADFESWYVCEFDKYAMASYNAIHGTNYPTSDVTQITAKDLNIIDTDKYIYILTYSFPCQDLSIAGKQSGMQKGSGTRSGLLWEVERLLDECDELPQVLLMENVPQVHSEDNIGDFNAWLRKLESLGYKNYYKDLNSKDFGVPQNRNRTFCVSILGDYYYEFPDPIPLKLKLKDLLEPTVDEKYYLDNEKIKTIMSWNAYQKPLERVCGKNSVVPTLTARGAGEEHSGMITCCEQFENTTNFQEKYSQFVNVEREREREVGHTVRAGGRASLDRHSWDIVVETSDTD